MPRVPLFLLRLLVLLALLPAQLALASVTTGMLKGTTIDDGGLPIPGVLVSIRSPNMMGARQQETDAEGRFLFAELPPGTYDLVAEKAGFSKVTKTGIEVQIGRTSIVTVAMPLQSAGEEIIVEETRPNIDTESTNRGSVLSKDFLQRIPSGRSYQGAVQMAAGVTGGANPNVGGAASNENTYLLDGVNITDPVTGTFSLNFNFNAIEQVEVLTSAFDPEYGVNLGGIINIVTESGGNTLEYQLAAYYTNGDWSPKLDARYSADGYQLAPTDFDSTFQTYQIYAKISGPIIRDKMWFVTSYAHERSLIALVGIDLPRDYEGHYVYTKLTWQPTSAHRFTFLGQTNPTTVDNNNQGDRFVEPSAQYRQAQGGFFGSLQWQWFPTATASFDSKNSVQKSFIELSQVPCTHDEGLGYNPCESDELENTIDYTTPGRLGSYNAYDRDNFYFFMFDDRWRISSDNKFSLLQVDFLGTHDFKAGVAYDYTIRDYMASYTGDLYYADLNASSYDPSTLNNWYWVEVSGPRQFIQSAQHFGAFIQDAWKPLSNLTVRYGVRYDYTRIYNDVGEEVISVGLFGPRLGISWDPWGNGKTKFVASMGRFNDTANLGSTGLVNRTGQGSKLFMGEYYDHWTNVSSENYSYSPAENTDTYLENLIAPHSDDFNIGAERELIQDVVASLYFQAKFTQNLFEDDEINLIWDEDGYNTIGYSDGTDDVLYRLRSPDIAQRTYYQTVFGLARRFADRWQVQGNYSFTRSRGTTLSQVSSFLDVAPQNEYYLNGTLITDITHDVAIGAVWDVPNDPWTTSVGSTFSMESGTPQTRYYYAAGIDASAILQDTVGTYEREENAWSLSLRVEQAIPVRRGKLSAAAELSNITNNRQGLNTGVAGSSAYVSADNRWIIAYRQSPMRISVGVEYEF